MDGCCNYKNSCPSATVSEPTDDDGRLSDSDSDSSCGRGPSPLDHREAPTALRERVAAYCGVAADHVHLLGTGNSGVVFSTVLNTTSVPSISLHDGSNPALNSRTPDHTTRPGDCAPSEVQQAVAVKVVASNAHCKREVQALQLCAGLPHVPKLMGFEANFVPAERPGATGSKLLAVELLGPDLFEFTDRFRLNEGEIVLCGLSMLDALHCLHRRGLVHKSVKPENFCFSRPRTNRRKKWRRRTTGVSSLSPHRRLPCASAGTPPKGPTSISHASVVEQTPLLKIIDFGRCEHQLTTHATAEHYERRYTGWWYSINGLLGRPQGPVDDMMSLVYSLGFLLDDAKVCEGDVATMVPPSPAGGDDQPINRRKQCSFSDLRREQVADVEAYCESCEDRLLQAAQPQSSLHGGVEARRTVAVMRRRLVADEAIAWYSKQREAFRKRYVDPLAVPAWWKVLARETEDALLGALNDSEAAADEDGDACGRFASYLSSATEVHDKIRTCLASALGQWKQVHAHRDGVLEEIERLVRHYVGEREGSLKRPHSA